jgi:hypothetical protein
MPALRKPGLNFAWAGCMLPGRPEIKIAIAKCRYP